VETQLLKAGSAEDVRKAGELLREGYVVAFPTETVYGLGARADDFDAMRALYEVKQRPPDKKVTILIADPGDVVTYAAPLSKLAERLAEHFWPGPLTLVVQAVDGEDVGLRCPDCEATRAMLREAAVPVVAPSANLTGDPPARSAEDVLASFDGQIAAVLDGGATRMGQPSTVVRVLEDGIEVIRPGALEEDEILDAGQLKGD